MLIQNGSKLNRPLFHILQAISFSGSWSDERSCTRLLAACRLGGRPCFGNAGLSSVLAPRTTGARSGNSATSERSPPITWIVLRKVESRISVRFSRRETLSWVMPRGLSHACLRESPRAPEFLKGHLLRDQFSRPGLDFLALRGIQGTDNAVHVSGHRITHDVKQIWSKDHDLIRDSAGSLDVFKSPDAHFTDIAKMQ